MVAADRGSEILNSLALVPDVVVGDFDSTSPETMKWLLRHQIKLCAFPRNKDQTDGELALDAAIQAGASSVTLTAAWGGRMDHALGNLFLLRLAHERGVACRLIEESGEVMLAEHEAEVQGVAGETVSLIPLSHCTDVSLEGFEFPATGTTMKPGTTQGLSNLLINGRGKIKIGSGQLLIIRC